MAQIITNNGWGGWRGGWASYTAGNWINIENNEISVDESVVQTTDNLVTNLTNPDDTHYPSAKAVSDAITSSGGWDMLKSVYDPNNYQTDAFNYNNMYNKLTAGSGIDITANAISTASNFGTSSTAAATAQKEVSIPWITSLNVGQVVHILPSTTSTVANSTLKVNNFDAYPMRYNNAAITTSTDSIVRPANIVTTFVFDGTYWQFMWHWLDSNTTYSNMSASEAKTWTATNARTISASVLKWAIQTHAPISWSAYGSWWSGSASAPTQDAVYAKVSTIDAVIPSAATSSNQLADKDYVNDSINSVTAFYITKNAAGDQFATRAELVNAATYYSWGEVRVPTRNDYAIVLDDETHNDEVTRYIYNNGWEYQYTINESPLTQAQINALNSGITSAKVWQYDTAVTTIWWYGNIVTHNVSEFATSAQWTKADTALQAWDNVSDLVNDAWYLTTAPVTSVNWQTWAVTLNEWITKIFTLSSTSDLTNAQAAYDRLAGGKSPILKYSSYWNSFYVPTYIAPNAAYFTRVTWYGSVSSGAWEGVATIELTLSSWTVTAISHNLNNINISSAKPSSWTTNSDITLVI